MFSKLNLHNNHSPHTCTHTYLHAHLHTHTHLHAHTHTPTHTHSHTLAPLEGKPRSHHQKTQMQKIKTFVQASSEETLFCVSSPVVVWLDTVSVCRDTHTAFMDITFMLVSGQIFSFDTEREGGRERREGRELEKGRKNYAGWKTRNESRHGLSPVWFFLSL